MKNLTLRRRKGGKVGPRPAVERSSAFANKFVADWDFRLCWDLEHPCTRLIKTFGMDLRTSCILATGRRAATPANGRDGPAVGRLPCGLMQPTKPATHGHGRSTKMGQAGYDQPPNRFS